MADTGSQDVLAPSMGTTQRHVVHQQVAGESDLQQGAEAETCSRVDHNVAYIGDVAETEAWFEMALDLSADKKAFWGEVGLAH